MSTTLFEHVLPTCTLYTPFKKNVLLNFGNKICNFKYNLIYYEFKYAVSSNIRMNLFARVSLILFISTV